MEKRFYQRIPVFIECHCLNTEYFGTVVNLSEKGIFVRSQKISLPLESEFSIFLPLWGEMLGLPVSVCRLTKTNGFYDGIGAEIRNSPQRYMEFVEALRAEMPG